MAISNFWVKKSNTMLEKFNEIWDQENTEKITNMSKQVLKFIIAG